MTTDFTRGYMPPGVYIEENESVIVSSTGIPPTIVALVGQARGYMVFTEQIPFNDEAVTLLNKGIDDDSVEITVVSTRAVVDPADYTITKSVVESGHSPQDYTTTINRGEDSEVAEGTLVFVSYHHTPVDYFEAKRVVSFEDVQDLYGEPLNLADGSVNDPAYQFVLSPLSLGAKVAFENGAAELILCAAEPPTGANPGALSTSRRTKLREACDRTSTLNAVNVLVPLATDIASADAPGTITDLSNHVANTADDGFLRFAVIGFDAAVTTAPDTLLSTAAVANKRVMLAYSGPGAVTMYSAGVNASFAASHAYLAAAYAGRMASSPVQKSLTKQTISSFSGLGGTPLSNALKNQYSQSGVAVAEVNRLGRLQIRHGVTTNMTNINTREASVVRARDALVTMISSGFAGSDLIGEPIDADLVLAVKGTIQQYLEEATAASAIVAYDGLTCRQRPGDLSVIEVKFAYRPAYPLNYIAISFSIDMTTSAVEDTAEAA